VSFPPRAVFAASYASVDSLAASHALPGALAAVSPTLALGPAGWPLRRAAKIAALLPQGAPVHADLYTARAGGWSIARSETAGVAAAGRELQGEALELGRIGVFQDLVPPKIGLARAVRLRTPAPDRWALQCAISERGSGVDPSRTHYVIDGRVAPSEWDSEHGVLRWRPLHPPAAGAHHYEVVAVDRAGLTSRSEGRFVTR
jgi:hypothetical protein